MSSRLPSLLVVVALLCAPRLSPAERVVVHPVAHGSAPLSLAGDFVVLDPPDKRFAPADSSPWQVVYLNFDGAELKVGGNNAKTNTTDLILSATLSYPAMTWTNLGGKEKGMKAVVDELKLIFMKFAVKLVTDRPTDGDYTMAMVGGRGDGCKKGGAGTVGISPLDCKNTEKNDVTLIFGELMSSSAKKLAMVIAHELGHSFGLEHVSDPKGIMYPALNPSVCCWVTSSLSEGSTCGRTTQDAEKVLTDNVGPGKQDTLAPLAWFMRPGPGAVLPPDFSFEVTAADDLAVHHVVIYLDNTKVLELNDPPYTKALTNVSDGEHVLKAEVHDWAQHTSTTEVSFTVDSRCVLDGSCYAGSGGTEGACEAGADCASGLCALANGAGVCVEECQGQAAEAICPTGTRCDGEACLPFSAESGDWSLSRAGGDGGCGLAGPRPVGLPVPVLLLLGLALLSRGRGRPRARH